MPDPFLVKAVAKALLLPPTGFLLVALAGVVILGRRPKLGRILCGASIAALLVLSMPLVAGRLALLVDASPPLDIERARSAQAIVILGGGVRRHAAEYGGADTLGRLTLERVRYGAHVARQLKLPVLVTGGSVLGDSEPEARLMRTALEQEFGVRVTWTEERSRNTRENARMSAPILHSAGVRTIVLVVHSFDIPRASAEFRSAGIDTIPAPTGIPGSGLELPADLIPGVAGLVGSYYACYELAAMFWTRLTGV